MTDSAKKINGLNKAVLFLVFNRPDVTEKVFSAIRRVKPPRLYVAADGPRLNRFGESDIVSKVRSIATAVDWPCEVKTLFRDENVGCRIAVSGAISWFFEHEQDGIILEDDCLPSESFFFFCEELLDQYHSDDRIMSICGTNIVPGLRIKEDYFFSNYALMWGWATWARAWRKYDADLAIWNLIDKREFLENINLGGVFFSFVWMDLLERTRKNEIDTWDYQWIFSCWSNNGLTILPKKNLISNIGFAPDATHTSGFDPYRDQLNIHEISWPLAAPLHFVANKKVDNFLGRFWFHSTFGNAVKVFLLRFKIVNLLNNFKRSMLQGRHRN